MPELQDFSLVGGTALSLLYGHRISVDLDLFSDKPFENHVIISALEKKFRTSFSNRSTNPRFGIFRDIAELLQHFSIADFIRFHKEKYTTQNLLITVPQAITYFLDAEESEDPVSLKKQTWGGVKKFINAKVSTYLK